MKIFSSRWIDTKKYKSKEILLQEVGKVSKVVPSNKAKTFYKCLCVYHNEKNPSMKFFYSKYIGGWLYKCFGCGKSGDIFTFLMEYYNFEFWDALSYLKKNYVSARFLVSGYVNSNSNQIEIPFPKDLKENNKVEL